MHIGYDAKRFFHNHTGLGNYSRTLVKNLVHYFPEHSYKLYASHIDKSDYVDVLPEVAHIQQSSIINTLSRTVSLQDGQGLDIYHGLSNELPMKVPASIKTVVTIHDLFYEHFPEDFTTWDRRIYKWKTELACRQADHIIAVSQSTKQDIIKHIKIPDEKISVIYQTCHPAFLDAVKTAHITSLPERYMLYVGTLNRRKNLSGIIEALALLPEASRLPLVVVGTGQAEYVNEIKKKIDQYDLGKLIHFQEYVDNVTLKSYYEQAYCTILPSFYEGFGIPVLESLYCGKPVIVSDISALPEVAGEAGLLVNPSETASIAHAITDIQEPETYDKLIKGIPDHLKTFDPENLSKQLMDVYKSLI